MTKIPESEIDRQLIFRLRENLIDQDIVVDDLRRQLEIALQERNLTARDLASALQLRIHSSSEAA